MMKNKIILFILFILSDFLSCTKVNYTTDDCLLELCKILREGKFIISSVNSYALNNPDPSFSPYESPKEDHAILLTEIERDTNGDVFLWYCDTGIEDGMNKKLLGCNLILASNKQFYVTLRSPS